MYKIAWKRPWPSQDVILPEFVLSTQVPISEADALLCEWEPTVDLLHFPGPSVWYCCEPRNSWNYQSDAWRSITTLLPDDKILNHWHPNPVYRVPHITHVGAAAVIQRSDRIQRACAIVSNAGTADRRLATDAMKLRLRFCTYKGVDLYGHRENWKAYKRRWWSAPRLPSNYRGELEGTHWAKAKTDVMAGYKAAICLENSQEFLYFTEKFVAAVQAGCIPIYQAHPSVKETFLKGARWVDPGDYGFDPRRTIAAALAQPLEKYWDANSAWLDQPILKATERATVLRSICALLVRRADGKEPRSDKSQH